MGARMQVCPERIAAIIEGSRGWCMGNDGKVPPGDRPAEDPPGPEDMFYGGLYWVWHVSGLGLRTATPEECAKEIQRLHTVIRVVRDGSGRDGSGGRGMSDRYPDWRLPDSAPDRVWVLAAFVWEDQRGKESTEIIVAMRSGGDWADGDGRSGYRVTHWMPLPQLP